MKQFDLYNQRGFTLIELLVVLGLLALATAISIPLLGNSSSPRQLQSAVQELIAKIRLVKSEAVIKNQDKLFAINIQTGEYWGTKNVRKKLPTGVLITLYSAQEERVSDAIGRIRFFPDGTSTGGKLVLSRGDKTFTVTVDWLTGAVRLQ